MLIHTEEPVSRGNETERDDWLARALAPLWIVALFFLFVVVLQARDRRMLRGPRPEKPPTPIWRAK